MIHHGAGVRRKAAPVPTLYYPMFLSKPYCMESAKGGDKAYALLRRVLSGTKRVGIAKVVIKTREHLAAVKAQGEVLVLELMHFGGEIIGAEDLHVPAERGVGKKEADMAKQLVESMTGKWEPEKYKDDYEEALMEVIEEKVAAGGKDLARAKKTKGVKATNVIDLLSVLQQSIDKHGSHRSTKTAKRKAA